MDRSLLKRSSMIASNLETLLAKPLTLREATEIVCEVLSNEGNEMNGANLGVIGETDVLIGEEGCMPVWKLEFPELLLLLLLLLSVLSLLLWLIVRERES